MPRTPLMRALLRLAGDHAEAAECGLSVAEARERRASGVSRRDFLAGAGALGAGVALSRPSSLVGTAWAAGQAPRIAIVGAGIAGLNAALTLRDAGYATTVFESSTRIGGRMHSDTADWLNGQTSEWCGELIDTAHKTILGLARRFNLATVDLLGAEPNSSEDTYYFFGRYYPQKQADSDF